MKIEFREGLGEWDEEQDWLTHTEAEGESSSGSLLLMA